MKTLLALVLLAWSSTASGLYSPTPELPVLHTPCPTDGSSCRIMMVGSDRAEGGVGAPFSSIDYSGGGVMAILQAQAIAHGKQPLDFVGRFSGPSSYATSAAPYHKIAYGSGYYGISDFFPADLATYAPHIIIIDIGEYDLLYSADGQGALAATPATQYLALVDAIVAAAPNALLVLVKPAPFSPTLAESESGAWPWWNSQMDVFGRAIEEIYSQQRQLLRRNLVFLDAEAVIIGAGANWDTANYSGWGMLLSDPGYQALGQAIYNLLASALP